jgi:DNA-binding MarR family transcriptional regulator
MGVVRGGRVNRRASRASRSPRARADLLGQLSSALRAVDRRVERRLLRLGYADVRPGHLALLLNLERDGASGADLARRAGMTKQSMGELVRELELRDYVERRPDPRDGRARLVLPTGRGLMLVAHARQAIAEVETDAGRRIGAGRLAALRRALRDVAEPEASGDPPVEARPPEDRGLDR